MAKMDPFRSSTSRRFDSSMPSVVYSVLVSQWIWTPQDLDPRSKSASGYGPPSADLDLPTKLSENIILNVQVKMDDTLRSSAY